MHGAWVLCLLGAWWARTLTGPWHLTLGYGAVALVMLRVVWGLFSQDRFVRFSQFVRPWAETRQYLRAKVAGKASRHLGHNPLGGWMVLALLSTVALLGLTGWLGTTDLLWGYAWLVDLHSALAWALWALVGVHVVGVVLTSFQQHENLIAAMVTGRKRAARGDDIA